jgi:SAM-dependent methyltransferase
MAKTPVTDYSEELRFQVAAWRRKRSLRALYHRWYRRIVTALNDKRPVVEIGSGSGNFKAFAGNVVATDICPTGPWIDRIVDARALPFDQEEVGQFVLIDCLHHMPRPLRFLRAAARALKPGGRVVLLEPSCTPWARLIWRKFHHERMDPDEDFYADDCESEPENPGFTYSNIAMAWSIFVRHRKRFAQHVPELRITRVEHSDFLIYPATGGFSYYSFIPATMVRFGYPLERFVMRPFARRLTGMRLLIVLDKCMSD